MRIKEKRGAMTESEIGWLIIGVLVLVLGIGLIIYLKVKGVDLLNSIKNMFGAFGG